MSEQAPERIYVGITDGHWSILDAGGDIEYVRADIHATLLQRWREAQAERVEGEAFVEDLYRAIPAASQKKAGMEAEIRRLQDTINTIKLEMSDDCRLLSADRESWKLLANKANERATQAQEEIASRSDRFDASLQMHEETMITWEGVLAEIQSEVARLRAEAYTTRATALEEAAAKCDAIAHRDRYRIYEALQSPQQADSEMLEQVHHLRGATYGLSEAADAIRSLAAAQEAPSPPSPQSGTGDAEAPATDALSGSQGKP
jgi:chromosome segregation ATPase